MGGAMFASSGRSEGGIGMEGNPPACSNYNCRPHIRGHRRKSLTGNEENKMTRRNVLSAWKQLLAIVAALLTGTIAYAQATGVPRPMIRPCASAACRTSTAK